MRAAWKLTYGEFAANAGVDAGCIGQQALFPSTSEERSMRNARLVRVSSRVTRPRIEMPVPSGSMTMPRTLGRTRLRVKVNDRYRAVYFVERSKDGKHDGVITA
jgi:hypothetical protein